MKRTKAAAALLCALMLSGCASSLENNVNLGKNAPAVVGTLASVSEVTEAPVTEETKELSPEEIEEIKAEENNSSYRSRAGTILSSMTREEKAGQILLARLPDDPAGEMEKYSLGGYTFYADDFKNRDRGTAKTLAEEITAAVSVAPFIAADEEGGTVVRVSKFAQFRDEPFSSPQILYQRGGTELLEIDCEEKAQLLTSLGVNLNLAPVADISADPDSYIYSRTIGMGAEETAEAIGAIVSAANDNGLASCLKHFPGYGDNTDTHEGAAHDPRELSEFYERDFLPFKAGITVETDKTPAVMVGHTIYDMIEENTPASLSPVIHRVLRNDLGFEGVIVTDDMGMDAIKAFSGDKSPYVLAVLADNDLICVTDYKTAYSDIISALDSGDITEEELDAHVTRILIMKLQYGIIK